MEQENQDGDTKQPMTEEEKREQVKRSEGVAARLLAV